MTSRTETSASAPRVEVTPRERVAWADTLKVVLVAGVIVAHTTMAWTGVGNWVFREPYVREPLLTPLVATSAVAVLFGMPLFFLIAGYFTPRSLAHKGARRFVGDRAVRLLVPMAAFILLLSPPIEYVDPDNAGWTKGFWAFVPHMWWPPAPGPTWFLGVLFVLSAAFAAVRTLLPLRTAEPAPLRVRLLLAVAAVVAVASFVIRIWAPMGEERWRLAVAQSPGWVAGFALGVVAAERGWLPLEAHVGRRIRRLAWAGIGASVAVIGAGAATGYELELFLGGGTWQSGVLTVIEGVIIVTAPLWLVDLFQRRVHGQGPLGRVLGRAAFGAFLVHQGVLVALVLLTRQVGWPPEPEYLAVSTLGVVLSFAIGAVLTRLPGVSRIV